MPGKDVNQRLLDASALRGSSLEEWNDIVQSIVTDLGTLLNVNMTAEPVEEILDGEAVCVEIWQVHAGAVGELCQHHEGTLGIVAGRDPLDLVDVTLFEFVGGTRVARSGGEGDYLELRYVPGAGGERTWNILGWAEDEYDEFSTYDTPRHLYKPMAP